MAGSTWNGDEPGQTTCAPQVAPVDVGALYEAHAAGLCRRMARVTRDDAAAEDLTQDAFIRLIELVNRGIVPENVGGWLYRVAWNAWVSEARHAGVAARHEARLQPPVGEPSPEDAVAGRETARALEGALGELCDRDRAAIAMAANGASSAQIGRRTGRSEVAARAVLSRARARVRVALAAAVGAA